MKALVISDLHSNLPALRAVFASVQRKKIAATICLGDVVGYGAQPNQVVELLRRRRGEKLFIRGNHDRAASLPGDPLGFNQPAKEAILWTRSRLTPANRTFIRSMPQGPTRFGEVLLCHGAPGDEDEYLFSEAAARAAFEASTEPLILFGHTHLPTVFRLDPRGKLHGEIIAGEATITLESGSRYLVNPGSVGQPRDRDTRAAFAILDGNRITFKRAKYPVDVAARTIRAAGLPSILADRLLAGF